MTPNKSMSQWNGVYFSSDAVNKNNVNLIGLVFPTIQIGVDAITHLQSWKDLSVAFVSAESGEHEIHIYNKRGDTYILYTSFKRTNSLLGKFIDDMKENETFIITYFISPERAIYTSNFHVTNHWVVVHGYFYIDKKNFHYPHLSDRN